MTREDILAEINRLDIEHTRVRRALLNTLRNLDTTAGRVERMLASSDKPMRRADIVDALAPRDNVGAIQQALNRLVATGRAFKAARGVYVTEKDVHTPRAGRRADPTYGTR